MLSTQNAARRKNQQDRCRRGIKSVGVQKIAGSLDSTLICLLLLVSYQSLPSALNEKPFDCQSAKIDQSGGSLSSLLPKSSTHSANKSQQILSAFLVEPSRPPCPTLLRLHRHVDACVGQNVAGCRDASKVNRSYNSFREGWYWLFRF